MGPHWCTKGLLLLSTQKLLLEGPRNHMEYSGLNLHSKQMPYQLCFHFKSMTRLLLVYPFLGLFLVLFCKLVQNRVAIESVLCSFSLPSLCQLIFVFCIPHFALKSKPVLLLLILTIAHVHSREEQLTNS